MPRALRETAVGEGVCLSKGWNSNVIRPNNHFCGTVRKLQSQSLTLSLQGEVPCDARRPDGTVWKPGYLLLVQSKQTAERLALLLQLSGVLLLQTMADNRNEVYSSHQLQLKRVEVARNGLQQALACSLCLNVYVQTSN